MNKNEINLEKHYLQVFVLIIVSFIVSYSYPFLQYGIDGGLVLADRVKYPDTNSPMLFYYLNSWTSVHQLSNILIRLGFSIELISKILIFISTIFFSFGAFLFSFAITKKENLSLLIIVVAVLLGKNFGDTDYPSLIFSEHTFGMISLALVTFSIGLMANKNFNLALFFSILLISVHPIIGIWMLLIYIITFFFFHDNKIDKTQIISGIVYGVIFLTISLVFFKNSSIGKTPYDSTLFKEYLLNWDGHRAISSFIHLEYMFKTVLLGILAFLYLKKNTGLNKNGNFHIKLLLTGLIFSTIFYLSFKLMPDYFPQLFKIAMPSRFIMLHTFLGWPLIISFIFYFTKEKFQSKKIFNIFFIFLFLVLIQNYKKIYNLKENFFLNFKQNKISKIIDYVKN